MSRHPFCIAPAPYLAGYLAVTAQAIIRVRVIARNMRREGNYFLAERVQHLEDLSNAVHNVDDFVLRWVPEHELDFRRQWLLAYDQKWPKKENPHRLMEQEFSLIETFAKAYMDVSGGEPPPEE